MHGDRGAPHHVGDDLANGVAEACGVAADELVEGAVGQALEELPHVLQRLELALGGQQLRDGVLHEEVSSVADERLDDRDLDDEGRVDRGEQGSLCRQHVVEVVAVTRQLAQHVVGRRASGAVLVEQLDVDVAV